MAIDKSISPKDPVSCRVYDENEGRRLNIVIGIILITSFLLKIVFLVYTDVIGGSLNSYQYSEFLINYQGGFVRRGLFGETLYQIYRLSPFPIIESLGFFCFLMFGVVSVLFYYQFKKQNICWWLLLSPLFLNFTAYIVRKDYMLYAILIGIVFLLRPSSRDILNKSVACLLVIFSLFIHEAFIFWGFVLYAIILSTDKRHKLLNYSFIALPIVAVGVISFFKGSTEVAQAIISSWNAIIPAHPLVHIHDNSIGAIGWDTFHAFMFHLKHNVSPSLSGGGIILIPLLLSAAYYLFTNYMVYFSRGTAEERNAKRMEISLLYPVFCLTLIPMLTVLSCDTGRIFQYATITTFSAFLILPQQRVCGMFPGWYKTIIGRFNNWLDRRFPPTKTSLIFILLILAVNPYHFNLNGCWTESVIGSIISNCLNICAKLVKIFL